ARLRDPALRATEAVAQPAPVARLAAAAPRDNLSGGRRRQETEPHLVSNRRNVLWVVHATFLASELRPVPLGSCSEILHQFFRKVHAGVGDDSRHCWWRAVSGPLPCDDTQACESSEGRGVALILLSDWRPTTCSQGG